MKRIILLMTVGLACAVPAMAVATPTSSQRDTLKLDSYSKGAIPSGTTSFKLSKDTWYVATVSGTMSYWAPINYTKPQRPYKIVCGAADNSAAYSGSQGGNGPVGLDAEFVFARPWTKSKCAQAHLPMHWSNFQASTGGAWAHPQTLGATPTAPTADHTYNYVLLGHGKAAQFRLTDIYYRDNYGILRVSVRPATSADCATGYASFGFTTSAACTTAL